MSPHTLGRALKLLGEFSSLSDPGNAGTITGEPEKGHSFVHLVSAGAGETRTLADPAVFGQRMLLGMSTDGGDITITASTAYDEAGSTTILFDDVGEYVELVCVEVATGSTVTPVWRVVGFDGVTGPTLTVGGTQITASAAEINKLDDSLITLTTVDQTALFDVGRIHTAVDGKAYVYLEGIASVATGSVVTYIVTTTGAATSALAVSSAIGLVGVAMAAVVGGDFGWFQIAGLNLNTQCDSSAAIGAAYIGGTTGGVDHTAVAGDLIHGMHITVADSANVCGVFMTYPAATNASGL